MIRKLALPLIGCFFPVALSTAAPIQKTGPCPPLTRHPADPADNWGQFPVRPVPQDSFKTGTIQDNLAAAQSINCIEPAAGLKVELFASEEMPGKIAYLQHFTFDERGRVWAVEPKSYPNVIRSASGTITDNKFVGGTDRIVILEDTDGDKVMDKFKVFREGLNLPQSIEVVTGGVVVAMQPYIVFFPNNNDTSGTPEILFKGLGSSGTDWDTHGTLSSLTYGLDNWIYGHSGGVGCNVSGADCGWGHSWRFRHKSIGHATTEFQGWTAGPANAFGMGQMEDGQIFQSGATGTSHMNHSAVQGSGAIDIRTANPAFNATANPKNVFYPITGDRFMWEGSTGKNANGWFTTSSSAVSGTQFYTSRLFPPKYWNRFAFVCEGASKLCNQDSLVENKKGDVVGSSWNAYRLPGPTTANLVAAKDAWFAPILSRTGPDGAVWVLDWNNYLFLHNPAGPYGPGHAWNNQLRDKTTSRIYRVLPADATPEAVLDLSKATEDQLVSTFANPNFFWRLQAQRLLLAKGYNAALGTKLADILKTDKSVDAVGNSPRVQHAMWTLDGMGQIAKDPATYIPILKGLLTHPAWCVRRNALRVMPRTADGAAAINSACSVNDPHGHVRLQALLALGAISAKPTGMNAIWSQYRDVDTTATAAFQKSGITASDTKACEVAVGLARDEFKPGTGSAPRGNLRFQNLAGGFRLLPHGDLPSGELAVFDIHGRLAFFSRYDAARSAWTVAEAHGLSQPVYGYAFRGADGSSRRGSLALLGGR